MALSILATGTAHAQMSERSLDSLVEATRKTFDVPGIAVGIVKDGKLVFSKGYGVRSLKNNLPVDANTLFGIASNSKAFTAAALQMLVSQGKLSLDDKVTQYIPEFQLYDPYVTAQFTIRDLITHRSGLGLGAGDLMFFPEGGNISTADIIHNLRYLKPVSSFRSKYDYNNNMFIVAGEVIKRVSGLSWENFVEQNIMKPLRLQHSTASYNRVVNNTNIIDAHAPVSGKAMAIPHDWNETADPAGGIMSSVNDLSKWLITLMNNGKTPDSIQLLPPRAIREMWTLQTAVPVVPGGPYNAHFYGYGLGFFLTDVKGYLQAQHTGGLIGTVTQITMLPELKLGIIVLTNQQIGAAFNSITNSIKDSYLGYGNRGWLNTYAGRMQSMTDEANRITDSVYKLSAQTVKNKSFVIPAAQITGVYKDDWMGDINVSQTAKGLRIDFVRSPRLTGELLPLNSNTYIAKWDDRSYDADAYVTFLPDHTGRAHSIKMEAISPMTDFSFDFHDLEPKRVKQ